VKCSIVLVLVAGIAIAAGSHWSGPIDPGSPGSWQDRPGSDPNLRIIEEPAEQSPAPEGEPDWGNDILVWDIDSVLQVRLDRHQSDTLVCLMRYLGDSRTCSFRAFNSVDGTSWATGTRVFFTSGLADFDIACCSSHVYVVCPISATPKRIELSRYAAHDVGLDTFPDGEYSLTIDTFPPSVNVVDVAIVSNRFHRNDMLFIGAVTDDNKMHFYRVDIIYFNVVNLGDEHPDNATGGLDMCWNEGFPVVTYPLLFTYISTAGRVACYGFTADGDTHMFPVSSLTNGTYTSLSAWKDTFMFTYDYVATDGIQARYLTSYNGGQTWLWGVFGDTTQPTVRSAAVTGRAGYGQAVSFWQYPQQTAGVSFTHRPYRGAWSEPVRIQDHSSYSNRLSDIEHIGNGAYGIVYIRSTADGMAYFDRSDWTGVQEPVPIGAPAPNDARTTIVRGVLRLPAGVDAVLLDVNGRKVMDLPGVLASGAIGAVRHHDISKVMPGVYFVRSEGSPARNRKVVVPR